MIWALAGNPNSGKTTLFNRLTGSNQRVGNWPGVTVERRSGRARGCRGAEITDLPGLYSLTPYTPEEHVAREFLLNGTEGIINIVDATALERGLYLTLQLLELGHPTVIALNMMDEARDAGDCIDITGLSRALGVPVIPLSARRGEGLPALLDSLRRLAEHPAAPPAPALPGTNAPRHPRAALTDGQYESLAAARYNRIGRLLAAHVRRGDSRAAARSRRLDRVLTHRAAALPVFAAVMGAVFWLTFGPVGTAMSDALAALLARVSDGAERALTLWQVAPLLRGLAVHGLLGGVFAMLSFLPMILLLFFLLSLLEDSGYMARSAFVTDRLLSRFGLSGRAFIPMLLGFGCTVPAILATRTIAGERERRLTIFLTPFMSCAARAPIYALMAAALFPGYGAAVMAVLYIAGVAMALLCAFFLRDVPYFRDGAGSFMMELPPYRLPTAGSVLRLLWDKAGDFIRRAFTWILLASAVVWLLSSVDGHLRPVDDSSWSLLAALGGWLAPAFAPLGFGDWRSVTALLAGLSAKEAVLSTLAVLCGTSEAALPAALGVLFTPASGAAFLTFVLLYTPCAAALTAARRELGGWRPALAFAALQTGIAWLAAFLVFQVGRFLVF